MLEYARTSMSDQMMVTGDATVFDQGHTDQPLSLPFKVV